MTSSSGGYFLHTFLGYDVEYDINKRKGVNVMKESSKQGEGLYGLCMGKPSYQPKSLVSCCFCLLIMCAVHVLETVA